jgi:hypothetical protein
MREYVNLWILIWLVGVSAVEMNACCLLASALLDLLATRFYDDDEE